MRITTSLVLFVLAVLMLMDISYLSTVDESIKRFVSGLFMGVALMVFRDNYFTA